MGGESAEREVSLMSGAGVLAALQGRWASTPSAFDPAAAPAGRAEGRRLSRVFIALHGRHGEDGTVQGALELLGIPYTGSGVMASAIAMDKVMTKRVWVAEGLPTPRWRWLAPEGQRARGADGRARRAGPAADRQAPARRLVDRRHQGRGLFADAGRGALASRYDPDVLCEEFIDGIELTCPVLGQGASARALPVVRIDAPDGNYDMHHKYYSDDTGYRCPSGLPAQTEEAEVQRITLAAYRALGCRGWGRADLMLRASDRKPFLLEMNTSPGHDQPFAGADVGARRRPPYERLCLQLLAAATLDSAR
jgi:D-alanine-D-alanine ligase